MVQTVDDFLKNEALAIDYFPDLPAFCKKSQKRRPFKLDDDFVAFLCFGASLAVKGRE